MRIGQGYDVHKLVEGRKLILGGVEILSAQAIEDLNKLPGNNEFLENLIRILIKRQK